ncbi:MAG TPA: HAMP domain-containing sensor histidine kinase, partial [Burkholderiales bacterium]|nr:HAMP domain-containing sensor histidine kinase [Burkholderiales bacterium]
HSQAAIFVDALKTASPAARARLWRGSATVDDLLELLGRFIGPERARDAFLAYARARNVESLDQLKADAGLVHHTESLLGGAIGSASARVMLSSAVDEEPLSLDEVLHVIDEASQALAYSRQLEQKSVELHAATDELRRANQRLQELDRMKDDFISMVTHELRTPLTSIRAFSEILNDHADLDPPQRQKFLQVIIKESERLTRLINQVLDLAKIESGHAEWRAEAIDLREVIEDSATTVHQLYNERGVVLHLALPHVPTIVVADRDRLMQVMLNLLSNAAKYCDRPDGKVEVKLDVTPEWMQIAVRDNGVGISPADQDVLFEKFRQVGDTVSRPRSGSGLGLAICRQIIDHFGGRLWVESTPGVGSTFSFTLPRGGGTAHHAPPPARDTQASHV